jgi:RNA polymerase sigma-70 factor (ECF subfamily)
MAALWPDKKDPMFGFGKSAESDKQERFAHLVTPHIDAAYNLARWLAGDDSHAQDIAQEAVLRAWQYFGSFRGDAGRPWLLGIVRRTFFDWRAGQKRDARYEEPLEAENHDQVADESLWAQSPESWAARCADAELLNVALAALPLHYREALVLRELEDLSYKEIARIIDVPVGTVMSRLARARELMLTALNDQGMTAYEQTR